ncbi:hypothetical protein MUK42_30400 [Musa troglodytarum]|uniref:Uncharacterized protein n=1 Tax=Musa troglodytarum TaxID=320322 RepID=A0A9E7FG02_9LILI|nr:hypothetical protein MUK42_30400 [Musa troglodytarum]
MPSSSRLPSSQLRPWTADFLQQIDGFVSALFSSISGTAGGERRKKMNWVSRKVHLYNVTMGLYMLDWWERCLFNILILTLLWFICYNGSRFAADLYDGE